MAQLEIIFRFCKYCGYDFIALPSLPASDAIFSFLVFKSLRVCSMRASETPGLVEFGFGCSQRKKLEDFPRGIALEQSWFYFVPESPTWCIGALFNFNHLAY